MITRLAVLALVATIAAGCGDDAGSTDGGGDGAVDGGSDADAGVGPLPSGATLAMPMPPLDPEPVTWPCPDGWREVAPRTEGGATVCSPWSAEGPLECARGEAQLPGETSCTPLGEACPSGAFPAGTPAPTIFVDTAAAPGGSGTSSAPFDSLGAAIAAASAGDVIALAKGEHAISPLTVPSGVTLRGACAAMTTLRTTDSSAAAAVALESGSAVEDVAIAAAGGAIEVLGTDASLVAVEVVEAVGPGLSVRRDTSLTGERVAIRPAASPSTGDGIAVASGATVVLDDSIVEEAQTNGVTVSGGGASFTLRGGVIRHTRRLSTGAFGVGVAVSLAGSATLERVALERNGAAALTIEGDTSRLAISDSVVLDTGPEDESDAGDIGIGILFDGGEIDVRRVAFERCTAMGIQLQAPGRAYLEDVLFLTTRPIPEGGGSGGILGTALYDQDAVLEAHRVSVEESHNAAVLVTTGGDATITDLSVLDTTHSPADMKSGDGLFVFDGGSAVLERIVIRRAEQLGLNVTGPDARAELRDIQISDVSGRMWDGKNGRGLQIMDGAQVTGERISVERAVEFGVMTTEGASATLSDVTVRDIQTSARSDLSGFGVGISAHVGAQLRVTRALVENAKAMGMLCIGPGTFSRYEDVLVRDTESWERGELFGVSLGRGMDIQSDCTVEIVRGVFESNREVGLMIFGEGTRVTVEDLVIDRTRPNEARDFGGYGLQVSAAAQVEGSYVDILSNRGLGLGALGAGASVDFTDVRIVDTAENPCAETGCTDDPGGTGAAALRGGSVRLERFTVAGSRLAGVMVAGGGEMDLVDGEVSGSPIGANVQDSDYDITRLQNDVAYTDNDTNLAAEALPVPQAAESVDVAAMMTTEP